MKFTIPVTIDFNLADYATEYGHPTEADAAESILSRLQTGATPADWVPQAITNGWPILRDLATVTAGAVQTDAAGGVAALVDAYGLDAVTQAVSAIKHDQANRVIVDITRKAVAARIVEDGEPAPVAVVFHAYDYDNGWFLDPDQATIWYADSGNDSVEIDASHTDALNDALSVDGACGSGSALAVRLVDGTVEYGDDYDADVADIVAGWIKGHKPA